ncbi:uncharacterized protein EDB91DRAFT_1081478 [Suillus paluster]|uniref:uncharacterized protein n=1 Tax=Suillus paluster TaxID=48578 RepID=UPI001B866344|nr:uncharacterized protein EDB91DRAFT_1081478 [Suillus paluster]KAG1742302.1 hypothetical protein EDB91DRAFT_1081478 [Suillus paluster]
MFTADDLFPLVIRLIRETKDTSSEIDEERTSRTVVGKRGYCRIWAYVTPHDPITQNQEQNEDPECFSSVSLRMCSMRSTPGDMGATFTVARNDPTRSVEQGDAGTLKGGKASVPLNFVSERLFILAQYGGRRQLSHWDRRTSGSLEWLCPPVVETRIMEFRYDIMRKAGGGVLDVNKGKGLADESGEDERGFIVIGGDLLVRKASYKLKQVTIIDGNAKGSMTAGSGQHSMTSDNSSDYERLHDVNSSRAFRLDYLEKNLAQVYIWLTVLVLIGVPTWTLCKTYEQLKKGGKGPFPIARKHFYLPPFFSITLDPLPSSTRLGESKEPGSAELLATLRPSCGVGRNILLSTAVTETADMLKRREGWLDILWPTYSLLFELWSSFQRYN